MEELRMRRSRSRQRYVLGVCLLLCFFLLEGCEPLRKKFIRKKKQDDTYKGEVIFEPVDYSPENFTAEQNYTKHYNYWVIWGKSLEEALKESRNEKRHRYFLEQGLKSLEQMRVYLKEEKRARLDEMIQEFKSIREEFAKPYIMWNIVRINNRINSNSIKIRTRFNPRDLQGHFIDQ